MLSRVRGIRGELAAIPLSNDSERFLHLNRVFLFHGTAEEGAPYDVESVWFHGAAPIFKFRGVDSISDAEPLRGAEVRLPIAERRQIAPGEYFESDLIGCEVIEEATGESLGRVTGLQESGGPGLLEVGDTLLVPFARAICVSIDPAARRIVVRLPEGLKDLNS